MSSKREQIFKAVIEIIEEQGFNSNLKISDIATRANIGKGTVYEYFSTKEEVISESLLYILESYKNTIIQETKEESFEVELRHVLERILNLNLNIFNTFAYKDLTNVFNKDFQIKINKKANEFKQSLYNYFELLLKKGINEQVISNTYTPFELQTAISIIFSMSMDYVSQTHNTNNTDCQFFLNNLYNIIIKILK